MEGYIVQHKFVRTDEHRREADEEQPVEKDGNDEKEL